MELINFCYKMASRAFIFTINNPEESDKPDLALWGASYLIYQLEVGENGTPHYQGYVYFTSVKRMSALKKINPKAHWEKRRGNHQQAKDYCSKEDTRVEGPFEFGVEPAQGKRNDIEDLFDAVIAGAKDKELQADHTVAYVKYYKAVDRIRANLLTPRKDKPQVYWYYGATGTGKTRKAFDENPDAYFKDMSNGKWWDGYNQQNCVVFDDMRKDTFKFHELLRILDRYPLKVEYKGGSMEFNSPKIIITSCFHPSVLYETREDLTQLLRRIDQVIEFKELRRSHPSSPPVEPVIEMSKVDADTLALVEKSIDLEVSGVPKIEDLLEMEPLETHFETEGLTNTAEGNVIENARKRYKRYFPEEYVICYDYVPGFNGAGNAMFDKLDAHVEAELRAIEETCDECSRVGYHSYDCSIMKEKLFWSKKTKN